MQYFSNKFNENISEMIKGLSWAYQHQMYPNRWQAIESFVKHFSLDHDTPNNEKQNFVSSKLFLLTLGKLCVRAIKSERNIIRNEMKPKPLINNFSRVENWRRSLVSTWMKYQERSLKKQELGEEDMMKNVIYTQKWKYKII